MKKKIFALMLTAIAALSFAACGEDAANDETAEVVESAVEEDVDAYAAALEKMADVDSMNAQMSVIMSMSLGKDGAENSIESVTTMDMTYFADPAHMKADMTVDMGELGNVSQSVYAEISEDGTYTMYLYDGSDWQKQTVELGDLEQFDARSSMLSNMDASNHFEKVGMESVDGTNAYRYEGVVTGEAMKNTILSSGMLDSFSSFGIGEEELEEMVSGLGEITVVLWIDEESLYPVRYELDMTEIMDKLITKMLESLGTQAEGISISCQKVEVVMTCSNYNEAADFEIPEEAKAD